jgi:hypothetical protein
MTVHSSNSLTARLLAFLIATVFLTGCAAETDEPAVPKNVRLELKAHFTQEGLEYPAVTCTYDYATMSFRLDTVGGQILGNGDPFKIAFSSTSDGDSFTATLRLETHYSVVLAPKSAFTSITVTQGETTIPPDSVLPAGEYTVTLTGKMPQPPAGEPKDDGSEG